ncbi:MAG: HAMP domain-containing sensor histidine kinase [Dehalococcoidia bacterium]
MLSSLSSRLLVAFALIIVLALGVSALGTLFLLRDQQRQTAEEHVGALAEPITLAVALLGNAGLDEHEIQDALRTYATSFDVRVLLVDRDGHVVVDTSSVLTGETIVDYRAFALTVTKRGDSEFRTMSLTAGGQKLRLFGSPQESLAVTSSALVELQARLFALDESAISRQIVEEQVAAASQAPDSNRFLPAPELRPLIVVPEAQITSAWRELVPQLAVAGAIALLAAALVAALISRTISRPLARITQAAQEMARGNYDQALDLRGQDEVGRLAQAFNAMTRQVSHSHQMMRDLLANVSHELKTPLTSIQGFSQAFEDGAISSPDEYREAGKIINEETQRMRRLVEDLIDLSRLESGQAVIQRDAIDLEEVLRVCVRRFEWRARESGSTIRLEVASLPSFEGDGGRLEQAFSNLIDNAVRHTPRGGTIAVRTWVENGAARVAVHNTGSYIPPEELSRIFERFYQLDRNRPRGSGRAGLGLAIAFEIVQAHQGAIEVSSDEQRGTEFVATLPLVLVTNKNGSTKITLSDRRQGGRLSTREQGRHNLPRAPRPEEESHV